MGVFRVSDFASSLLPVIIETDDPTNVQQYDMFHLVKPKTIFDVLSRLYPNEQEPYNSIPGGYYKEFGYYVGLFNVIDLAALYDSKIAKNVWEVKRKRILSLPYVTNPAGIFQVSKSLWRAPLYFTSTYWTKQLIGADKANRQGFNGEGVTTIVIDTGGTQFNRQTPQLQKHTAVYGNDVDSIGHGEWCASCIAGKTVTDDLFTVMQGKPVVCEGIAQACNIVEVKALDYVEGAGTDAELLRALYMSLQLGADIISCSWGGQENASSPEEDPYYKPIQTLVQASIIPVFAAGNSGPNPSTLSSPGWLPQVLTVGSYNAVDNSQVSSFGPAGEVSNFSSRGPTPWGDVKPDTVGPGAIIDSGITGWMMGSYTGVVHPFQAIAGTSMATPHIAGLVTLMRQAHRQLLGKVLTVDEVKEVLKSSGIEKTNDYGWGPLTWDLYLSYLETTYGLKLSG